jgi:DNA-binding NtrC family response regulator
LSERGPHHEEKDMASRSQKRKLRILVVDDDPHSREFLCDLLSRWHFHAISVANAWSVLHVLERNETNLVLLDHSSPTMGKDDTETLEEITRYAPDFPVIIMGAR